MNQKFLVYVVLAGASGVAWMIGCGSNFAGSSGTAASTASSASSTTGVTGPAATTGSSTTGQGGSGGASSSGPGATGSGGANNCFLGIDTECKKCAYNKCKEKAQACADHSMCNAQGKPTSGCLLLVECAATKCGATDLQCVLTMCGKEIESAGGASGPGAQAALALGQCVQQVCSAECVPK